MNMARPVGRNAAALKYDLLAAMGAFAMGQGPTVQRSALRLMTLITARYNWVRDELVVGQREMAALWSCDERTVKREVARLKAQGWLVLRRAGARGRVAEYRLDTGRILETTRPGWPSLGPDFVARLGRTDAGEAPVVPAVAVEGPAPGQTAWDAACRAIHASDPATYANWMRGMTFGGRRGAALVLRAPSAFHASFVRTHLTTRLLTACRAADPGVADLLIEG